VIYPAGALAILVAASIAERCDVHITPAGIYPQGCPQINPSLWRCTHFRPRSASYPDAARQLGTVNGGVLPDLLTPRGPHQ